MSLDPQLTKGEAAPEPVVMGRSEAQPSKLNLAIKASDYPEHDKLAAVAEMSNAIGEFLDYGLAQQGLVLCEQPYRRGNQSRWPSPTSRSIHSILAQWFDINEDALEAEKRAMIAALSAANESIVLERDA